MLYDILRIPVVSVVSGAIGATWSPAPDPVPSLLAIRLKQAEQHFVMSSVSSETIIFWIVYLNFIPGINKLFIVLKFHTAHRRLVDMTQ